MLEKRHAKIDARADIPPSRKSKLKKLMGNLELRYTRDRCYSKIGDGVTLLRFSVIAQDESSVAIVTTHPSWGREVVHIHFEGEYYWVCVGNIREYFRRVKR
jgi:hypothetical protein